MRYVIILLVLASVACSPIYIPNSRSVPLFEQAGEVTIDGALSTSGVDLNVGAAVSNNIAVIGNFSYDNNNGDDIENYHKHKFWEVGVGYFKPTESKLKTEFFGGYGMGEATSYDSYTFISLNDSIVSGNFNRVFIQGNIGYKPSDIFVFGAAIRLSYVTFSDFESTANSTRYGNSYSGSFAEPAFFLKLGDPISFNFQVGFNMPLDNDPAFDYRFFHMSLGIGAKINFAGRKGDD
ncbi:MAG TPA: hypothetical protein PKL31_11100 [Fulvivirga sp.]|nr:hypothetical protein [Fulvivirga sp.]